MKFMVFILPTVPATFEERERMRPIGRNNEKIQEMLEEVREIATLADDAGFDVLAMTEHHFHSEGLEVSVTPMSLFANLAARTRRIKFASLILALPTWDPLRLAEEIAMLDHLTRGRFIAGIGRGYQDRWVNVLGQKYGVTGARSDGGVEDRHNREVFEELFSIMKKAWTEDAFSFRGKHYQVPSAGEEGIRNWPVARLWTAKYGAPGEVDGEGVVRKISVVPKPYTTPHPPIWQAFSFSPDTLRWCAIQDLLPWILVSDPPAFRALCEIYRQVSAERGRPKSLGRNVGAFRMVHLGRTYEAAFELGQSALGAAFVHYFSGFGFFEGFRRAGEEGEVPKTYQRMVDSSFAICGTADDVKRQIDELRKNADPEWFGWYLDQGLMGRDEVRRSIELFATKVMPDFR
jgi:alkanesulfonate monooxygenase SsuD/methylene tetrahydromethanopterin reductase-like flavin-dependent oxidoreductase (luciferase family)